MSALTIACVLRSGGIYTREWVRALKRGLARHTPWPQFRYVTDLPCNDMWSVPLEHDWPGWWSKLELFRPGLFSGRVVYLDLDSLILDDISDVCAYDGPFAMLSDFYTPTELASGMMSWTGDECAHIYEAFVSNADAIMRRYPSRMDHWLRIMAPNAARLNDNYPSIVSLKLPRPKPIWQQPGPPQGTAIACGHGRQPRLDDPRTGWAHEVWRS